MNAKEIFSDIARDLRERPDRWAQGAFAYGPQGELTSAYDAKAVRWCLLGHVMKRADSHEKRALLKSVLRRCIGDDYTDISMWNDSAARSVDDVIQACERAAEQVLG